MWIKTTAGKNMSVDTTIVNYRVDDTGKERIVIQIGDVVCGIIGVTPDEANDMGYISHFITCPQVQAFNRK